MSDKRQVWIRSGILFTYAQSKDGNSSNNAPQKKKFGFRPKPSSSSSAPPPLDPEYGWGWTLGTVQKQTDTTLTLTIDDEDCPHFDGTTIDIPLSLIPSLTTDVVDGTLQINDDTGLPPDDLMKMTHLHEPSVVRGLRERFFSDEIYTATGPILLAVNPFKRIEGTYSDERMDKYWDAGVAQKKDDDPTLGPHVFRNADTAFRCMMKALSDHKLAMASSSGGKGRKKKASGGDGAAADANQSVLVSGESGAGKTVTTKFIMTYLATVSERIAKQGKKTTDTKKKKSTMRSSLMRKSAIRKSGNVEQKIVQSNPILESFGNARTHRNDNSSRFGKFIELRFSDTGTMIGAAIDTYLLEKIRLIAPAAGERNYHIFYEMVAGLSPDDRETCHFGDEMDAEDFKMLSRGETYDRRDGVEDEDTFDDLIEAFQTLGFQAEEETNILCVTAALLHAGNLTFKEMSSDESKLDEENEHLEAVLDLLGVEKEAFNDALCYFYSMVGKERYKRNNNVVKAANGLESLIKATFSAIFSYLVERVNDLINSDKERAKLQAAYIGVLDIFGFESFKVNSFEQLCINYCNEALQQQFNKFVFKNEQEVYTKEGIKWDFISFPDNQDSLDLIDKKGMGILSLLDATCQTPAGNDKTFAQNVYKSCATSYPRCFSATPTQKGRHKFSLQHYAGPVEYCIDGFVEKNKDELPKESNDLLLSSTKPFVKELATRLSPAAAEPAAKSTGSARPAKKKKPLSVGGQFTLQLQQLRAKIDSTTPHYVRCLKPNDILVADVYHPKSISEQLRCAGVIEAVRVSRVGYPQRYTHEEFMMHYGVLDKECWVTVKGGARKQCEALVKTVMKKYGSDDDSGVQLGKTKVFMKAETFVSWEERRVKKIERDLIIISKFTRGFLARRRYRIIRKSIIKIQAVVRGHFARNEVKEMRKDQMATVIVRYYRRYKARNVFVGMSMAARWLQRVHRGRLGRRRYRELNKNRMAIVIQRAWRRYYWKRIYDTKRRLALMMQCVVRCHVARKVLKKLKMEAKDLGNVTVERDRLKQEVEELRAALKKNGIKAPEAPETVAPAPQSQSSSGAEANAAAAKELKKMKERETKAIKDAQRYRLQLENTTLELNELKRLLQDQASNSTSDEANDAAAAAANPAASILKQLEQSKTSGRLKNAQLEASTRLMMKGTNGSSKRTVEEYYDETMSVRSSGSRSIVSRLVRKGLCCI